MSQLQQRQGEVHKKQEILQNARLVLKREFVGIDNVIDDVVDTISSWYLFPDMQEKPLVINLWGLTGVGKSSLVKRLAALLEFQKQFFHFDLGEDGHSEYAVKQQLERIYEYENGYPVMLALDEFQHARTLDEMGCEIAKPNHRVIWQLLDSGRFHISRYAFGMSELYDLMIDLNLHLINGVKVKEGFVVKNVSVFRARRSLNDTVDQPDEKSRKNNSDLLFVPASYYERIYDHARELFDSFLDVRARLLELDGPGTVKFLKEILACVNSPKEVDCSKGLIFVLGNLDEAYRMSDDQNADINADEFHEQSLKINVPEIKRALRKRFRTEQVGRLGNHHIIYPAMSRRTFEQIIALELGKIACKAKDNFGLELHFDSSLHALLYREGVYPTHGTRPVFTTIYQLVQSRMGTVVSEMLTRNLVDCAVHFRAHSKGVLVEFRQGDKVLDSILLEQEFALEKLRESKRDDVQAITAVHESGHAILAALLMRVVPEVVYATTTEVGSAGFAYIRNKWMYISRKEITLRLAMMLGGMAAEKVVFGEENVTTGASGDIERVTNFITEMLKDCGMGTVIGSYNAEAPNTRNQVFDTDYRLNREAQDWIAKAAKLAEDTLREHQTLLLHMANHLSDNRQLIREEIVELLKAHAVNFDTATLIEVGDHLFYRNHLKQKVQQLNAPASERGPLNGERVVLNRKDKH